MTDTGAIDLGNAIIAQAAEDYKKAFLGYKVDDKSPEWMMKDCERYFKGDQYESITGVDPDWLMREIKKVALEEIIELYEMAEKPDEKVQIKILLPKHKKEGKSSFTIPPRFMDDFMDTIGWQKDEIKREMENLINE